MAVAIHVDIEIDRLADAQIAELRLLEIGVDPDFVERADRHQSLANLDIVARIDIPARDDTIDLRDDVAVSEIELRLGEIALRDLELGLRLLDVRGVRRQPGEGAVDVALLLERLDHVARPLVERMDDAELGRALDQRRLRLEHGRKGLIEIGRDLAEILRVGLRRQAQRGAGLTDIGQRRDDVRAGRQQDGLPPVVLRPWGIVRHHQLRGPVEVDLSQREFGLALVDAGDLGVQQGDLVVDVLHGVLQRPAPAHGLRFDATDFGPGHLQVRRSRIDSRRLDRDCDLKRLLVQLDQKVAFAHPVVVVHQNPRNLALDAGGDERHVTVDIGIVRRNCVEGRLDPGNAEPKGGGQDQNAQGAEQHFSPRAGLLRRDCRSARRVPSGWRQICVVSRSRLVTHFARLTALLAHHGFPSSNE